MQIFGLALDEKSKSPILILKADPAKVDEERVLPIWIGSMEAMSISIVLNQVPFPRPMTHDLLLHLLKTLDGTLEAVEITDITDGTFYAEMVIVRDNDTMRLDCRPSDGVAVAIRAECPIRVAPSVIEQAGVLDMPIDTDVLKKEESDKWTEELEKFSEDETKYKM